MERKEILSKLSRMKVCVANVTYTYDIGIMFDLLSSEGVSSEEGYNINQWPCFKVNMSEQTRDLFSLLKKGEQLDKNELLKNNVIKQLCTYHSYQESDLVNDELIDMCLDYIRKEVKNVDCTKEFIYVFVCFDYIECLKLFSTYSEMEAFFFEQFNSFCRSWEEMDDEELENWYKTAEENDWEGVPLMEIKDE